MLENASKYRIQEKNAKVANRYIWLHKYDKSLHLKDKKGVSKNDKNTVCLPRNICRSTMAQYVFQNLINRNDLIDQFYIDSAATSREEIGNPVHHGTRRKLKEVGIPCGDHRARQLEKREYDEFDY